MNKLKTTHNGGMGLELDDFRFMDNGYRDAFKGILSAFKVPLHHAIILSGCVRSVANNQVTVSEGYVSLAGEVMYMPTQSYPLGGYEYIVPNITYANTGDEAFQDGNIHSTYEVRQAHIQVSANQIPTMPHIFQMLTIYDVIQSRLPQIANNSFELNKLATETQVGRLEIATHTETNSGTDDSRAVTPKKLKAYTPRVLHKSSVWVSTSNVTNYSLTINTPYLGSDDYYIVGCLYGYHTKLISWTISQRDFSSFNVHFSRQSGVNIGAFLFSYMIIKN